MNQLFCYILSLKGFTILVLLTSFASTQPDLCRNPKIDSIEWIESQKQFFFTSGGYWWLIKEIEMPPPAIKAQRLMHGFTRGDSAVLKDTLTACTKRRYRQSAAPSEQEIIVTEKMPDGRNMLMVYDLRDKQWKAPVAYSSDRFFSSMRIDWSKSIDAMFSYNVKELYGVQGTRYAGVNFTKICANANNFAESYNDFNISDFKTLSQIDAMFSRRNKLFMFQGEDYFEYEIEANTGGKFTGLKSKVKSVAKDFFKFTDVCTPAGPPPTLPLTEGPAPPPPPPQETAPLPPPAPQPTDKPAPPPVTEEQTEPQAAENPTEESKKSGMLWIIIAVILLLVVIAVIAILAFVLMRKKKGGEKSYRGSRSGSKERSLSGGKERSISGTKERSRSGVGAHESKSQLGSQSGSNVGSHRSRQFGSKAVPRTPSASPSSISRTQGRSPSQVSQRSALS